MRLEREARVTQLPTNKSSGCRVRLPLRFVLIVLRKRSYTWLKNIQITRQFSSNQLIWKISPKIVSSGAIIVNLAAYIAAGLFNEGSNSLLYFLNTIGISCGHNAHTYVERTDEARISLAEKRAAESTREGRLMRRQQQIAFLELATSAEDLLYGPGIDNSM